MEAKYLAQVGGYIVDNPNVEFVRCDGTVYSFDEISTAGVTNTKNSITITGGQGAFPLAYIDTDSTMEMTFASSQFTLDMFEMTQNLAPRFGDFGTRETGRFEVLDGNKIEIPYEVKAGSVFIRGLTLAEAAAKGSYTVTTADGKATVTFAEGEYAIGDVVRVSYIRRVNDAAKIEVKSNSTTTKGELFAHWPVYSSGTDCTEGAVKGWLHMHMARCRATALPGMDNSYKSAATQQVTFALIDAKRADKTVADWIYEPATADGSINTEAVEDAVEW